MPNKLSLTIIDLLARMGAKVQSRETTITFLTGSRRLAFEFYRSGKKNSLTICLQLIIVIVVVEKLCDVFDQINLNTTLL